MGGRLSRRLAYPRDAAAPSSLKFSFVAEPFGVLLSQSRRFFIRLKKRALRDETAVTDGLFKVAIVKKSLNS